MRETNLVGFPYAALTPMHLYFVNLKAMTIEFCAVDKNEPVSLTFWQ